MKTRVQMLGCSEPVDGGPPATTRSRAWYRTPPPLARTLGRSAGGCGVVSGMSTREHTGASVGKGKWFVGGQRQRPGVPRRLQGCLFFKEQSTGSGSATPADVCRIVNGQHSLHLVSVKSHTVGHLGMCHPLLRHRGGGSASGHSPRGPGRW